MRSISLMGFLLALALLLLLLEEEEEELLLSDGRGGGALLLLLLLGASMRYKGSTLLSPPPLLPRDSPPLPPRTKVLEFPPPSKDATKSSKIPAAFIRDSMNRTHNNRQILRFKRAYLIFVHLLHFILFFGFPRFLFLLEPCLFL
jgi:hypothetical protein